MPAPVIPPPIMIKSHVFGKSFKLILLSLYKTEDRCQKAEGKSQRLKIRNRSMRPDVDNPVNVFVYLIILQLFLRWSIFFTSARVKKNKGPFWEFLGKFPAI